MTTAIHNEKNHIVQTYTRPEFVIERGEGVYLYDGDGKRYTDWVSGIAVNALGYNDAGLNQAIHSQLQTGVIHVSNLYHTEPHAQLAKNLCESSFADKVFFCNSGAEANEGALKFAHKVAYMNGVHDKNEVVCFSQAFHGRTAGALSVTPKEKYQKPFKPLLSQSIVAEFNNIESAKQAINKNTVAVIVEPIQGEGGVYPANDDFLKALRAFCDEHHAMLIFDEIQCGVGRTGTFWAHETSGVTPDIMTVAKPLAGGLPIGAILVTDEVASALQPGDHGSTFAGGLMVTNAADYVVQRIQEPAFLEHVAEVGEYLMERLSEINSPHIVDVRGRGLMVAMELDMPVGELVDDGYEHDLLLVNAGANTLRFIPPLIIEKQHVDELVDKLYVMLETIDE